LEAVKGYECLDPRGLQDDILLLPPTERIENLNGKTVYFVDINKKNSDVLLKKTMSLLSERYPNAHLVYYPKTTGFTAPEPEEWWNKLKEEADAAVVAVGD
jgi:hypothetical protein